MNNVGIAITTTGAGVIVVDQDVQGNNVVTDIRVLPFNVEEVVRCVEGLEADATTQFIVDSEGLGGALWDLLAPKTVKRSFPSETELAKRDRWRLYEVHGTARQELVNILVIKIHNEQLHFMPDLEGQDALTADLPHPPQVGPDGLVGSALVVALALAVTQRPRRRHGWA